MSIACGAGLAYSTALYTGFLVAAIIMGLSGEHTPIVFGLMHLFQNQYAVVSNNNNNNKVYVDAPC
jgi:hypothetical protein